MSEVQEAANLLQDLGLGVNLWSVTSYSELARDALSMERSELMGTPAGVPYLVEALAGHQGVFVAASDYMKALPLSVDRWIPGPYTVLGTDGFGLSESRQDLRRHFEVSAEWIAYAALATRARCNLGTESEAREFADRAGLDLDKPDPRTF